MSYIKLIFISIVTLIGGIVLFLFHNNWIIVLPKPQNIEQEQSKIQKTVSFFYPTDSELKKESHTLLWSHTTSIALQQLVSEWLTCMQQENKLSKKIGLQTIALNSKETEAYISLDISPFTKQQSTLSKLLIVEALLKTIYTNIPVIQTCMLLVNQTPIDDPHIDFSRPLPITGYLEAREVTPKKNYRNEMPIIVINPATTARTKGRSIGDTFERPFAVQCAYELKKNIVELLPQSAIFIPRVNYELETQHTTYTNKPDTSLVVSLNFYHHAAPLPHCAIYYYVYNMATDFWKIHKQPLELKPYTHAYKTSINESYAYATELHTLLTTNNILTSSLLGMPFKPLVGIIKPAIALEIGLREPADVEKIMPTIAQAIAYIFNAARISQYT